MKCQNCGQPKAAHPFAGAGDDIYCREFMPSHLTPDHTELVREARRRAVGARSWAKMQPRGSEERRDADSDADLYDRLADALGGKG